MAESKTTQKQFLMWGIKVRGKHHIFCAFEKSNHCIKKCEELRKIGVVCKIVELRAVEVR